MAQTGFPAKWFVALDGKKVGPFAPEQILGLLADGEIPESVRVSVDAGAEPLAAGVHPEMTASELREIYFREDRIPTALPVIQAMPDIPFAPDLPLDGEKSREILVANELATTRRLFDLFQTAREAGCSLCSQHSRKRRLLTGWKRPPQPDCDRSFGGSDRRGSLHRTPLTGNL